MLYCLFLIALCDSGADDSSTISYGNDGVNSPSLGDNKRMQTFDVLCNPCSVMVTRYSKILPLLDPRNLKCLRVKRMACLLALDSSQKLGQD